MERDEQASQLIVDSVSAPTASAEYRNKGRRMFSRKDLSKIEVVSSIAPGKSSDGCYVCFSAPSCCPLCSTCPCCSDAEYITIRKQSSTYIYIRENSIEWNDPIMKLSPGSCCGIDPCLYDIQDNIRVLYFDDIMFDSITGLSWLTDWLTITYMFD